MSKDSTKFLPMVAQVLADIKKGPKGVALSPQNTQKWATKMQGDVDPEVSVQLLVLVKRFIDLGADRAAEQTFGLALLAMGERAARDQLERSGIGKDKIEPLLRGAKEVAQLARGLQPPSKNAGLSLSGRKKR